MPLTDAAIRNAKLAHTVRKLSDGGGLQLWIMPGGSRLWRLAYRFSNKQKKLAIGSYPDIGLADARKARDAARALLAAGTDPGQQKRLEKLAKANSAAATFGAVADDLLAKKKREGKAEATIVKIEWLLSLAVEKLGKRPVADVLPVEVLDVLRPIEAKGQHETAHRLRAMIGEVFRFAIASAKASSDPTYALRGALTSPKVTHRAAIIDPVEFGALLRAIDGFEGQPETVAALKLMALLYPRPGELRLAQWPEFDLDAAVWIVPAARTKMRREHRAPLPRQAVAVLRELHAVTGRNVAGLVFPGTRVAVRPISENTMNGALRRLGYSADEMTAHGFRAAASTMLNESGKFSADAIERALGHQEESEVRRAYARGAFWDERVRMGQWWADYLDTLRVGAKVIAFNGGKAS